jgi:hypothetical protein
MKTDPGVSRVQHSWTTCLIEQDKNNSSKRQRTGHLVGQQDGLSTAVNRLFPLQFTPVKIGTGANSTWMSMKSQEEIREKNYKRGEIEKPAGRPEAGHAFLTDQPLSLICTTKLLFPKQLVNTSY